MYGRRGGLVFIKMTYREIYYSIIDNRKKNPLPKDQYGEVHHIKPRSVYPEFAKDKSNLVRLTASEHYRCHYLLVKMYEEDGNIVAYRKMLYAFNQMNRLFADNRISKLEVEELSKLYSEVKVQWQTMLKGRVVSEETSRKLSKALRGRISTFKGHHHTDEARHKMREAKIGYTPWNKGKKMSEEYRRIVSENHADVSGRNNPNYGRHDMRGRKWFNNGIVCVRELECPEGFVPGRLKKK